MTDTAAAQLRRILHLIPQLADGEPHPIAEVAQRAGVDRAVLLQDIRTISERFDTPGGFVEGLQIFLAPDTVVGPPESLPSARCGSPRPELCALELGLAMLRDGAAAGGAPRHRPRAGAAPGRDRGESAPSRGGGLPVRLARPRGRSGAPPPAARGDPRAPAGPAHLSQGRAPRSRRPGALPVRHRASPAGCGTWWPTAATKGLRFFRLDRMEDVEMLDERYERPTEFSLEAVMRDGRAFQAQSRRRSGCGTRRGSRGGSRSGKGRRSRRTGRWC